MGIGKVLAIITIILTIIILIGSIIVEIKDDNPTDFCRSLKGLYGGDSETINNIIYLECCIMEKQLDGSYKKECGFYKWRNK